MEEFLRGHGVPSETIDRFIANGITLELFQKLKEEHLKELCPHLGTRLKIEELMTAYAPTVANSESEPSESEPNSASDPSGSQSIHTSVNQEPDRESAGIDILVTRAFPDFDLKTLLQTTAGGNHILNFYNRFGTLDNTKRNQLTDIIIKHLYTHIVHCRVTNEEYNVLAAKIITLFPKESVGTYFLNPIKKGLSPTGKPVVAKGKLVDKVRNLLFKFGDRKRAATENNDVNTNSRRRIEIEEGTPNEDIEWLKHNSEPWEEVLQKWKKTFPQRREDGNLYTNIHDLFTQWPILNDLRSEQLINLDFNEIHPEKSLKFYMNWSDFFQKLILLKNTTDENIVNILTAIEKLDDDSKIPGQIQALVYLVPPKGRLNKKVKFTTQESLDSIFICCSNPGDIDTKIEEQKQKAKARKTSLQPFIVIQGSVFNPSAPLLVIDNIKYKFNHIAKAFDTLFKCFHAFHAEYPRESNHIHLIIQRCVYKITTKYDNIVPSIVDVLNLQ